MPTPPYTGLSSIQFQTQIQALTMTVLVITYHTDIPKIPEGKEDKRRDDIYMYSEKVRHFRQWLSDTCTRRGHGNCYC